MTCSSFQAADLCANRSDADSCAPERALRPRIRREYALFPTKGGFLGRRRYLTSYYADLSYADLG